MANTVARLKQGDLLIEGKVDEQTLPVTNGLRAYFPMDGNTNSSSLWKGASGAIVSDAAVHDVPYSSYPLQPGQKIKFTGWFRKSGGFNGNFWFYAYQTHNAAWAYSWLQIDNSFAEDEWKYIEATFTLGYSGETIASQTQGISVRSNATTGKVEWKDCHMYVLNTGTEANLTYLDNGVCVEEATTNLVSSPSTFSSGWSSYTNGNDGAFRTEFGVEGLNIINRQSWCGASKSITLPGAGTYTFSVYVKPISRTDSGINQTLYVSGWGGADSAVSANWTKAGQWQKLTLTLNCTTTAVTLLLICYGGSNAPGYNITAQYTMPQVEQKTFATSFVDGSRGEGDFKLTNVLNPRKGTVVVEATFFEDNTVNGLQGADQYCFSNQLAFNVANAWVFHDVSLWYIYGSDGVQYSKTLSTSMVRNQRTHLVFVYDDSDGTMDCYMNGNLVTNGTKIPGMIGKLTSLGTNWTHSGHATGTSYKMCQQIHSLAFYDTALTAAEAQKIYKASFNVSKVGDVKTKVVENIPNMSVASIQFPLGVNGVSTDRTLSPVTDSNTVYENGAAWIGQPTTNVITNTDWSNWSTNYNSGLTYDSVGPNGINSKVISFIDADGDGSGFLYCYGDYAPQASSTTYTISVWVKTEAPFTFNAYTADNVETGRKRTENVTVNPEDEWKRVVFNPITTNANNDSASLSFQFVTIAAGKRVWMCAPQMEATTYPTPFTTGTRSATDLHLPYNTINMSKDFTICGWWKPYTVANGTYNGILTFNGRSSQISNKRILIMENSTSNPQLRAWIPVDGVTEKYIYVGSGIKTDQWNFFALVRTGFDIKLVHGVPGSGYASSTSIGATSGFDYLATLADSTYGWLVGKYATGSGNTGNAYYRDYMFVQSALSDASIQSIYNAQMKAYKNSNIIIQGQIKEGKVL